MSPAKNVKKNFRVIKYLVVFIKIMSETVCMQVPYVLSAFILRYLNVLLLMPNGHKNWLVMSVL